MKIVGLISENVKRLSAVDIRPGDGGLVQITGRNAQGKSSILDSLWLALEYGEAVKLNPQPLKNGADHGRVELDLGEIIVKRTLDRKADGGHTTSLTVTNREGAAFPKPQAMLDSLIGKISMDPIEFMRAKPREQFDMLKGFVHGYDFDAMEKANKADYDRRTEINRLAKEARASAALIQVPEQLPAQIPDVGELTQQMATASQYNQKISERILNRQKVSQAAQQYRERANELAEEAQALLVRANKLDEESRELMEKSEAELARVAKAPELPKPIDTAELANRIQEALGLERLVARVQERDQRIKQAEQLEATAKELTAAIAARDAAKERAIAEAKLPIEGLGLGDGIVLLNGVPLEQASGQQKLMTSAAIAMASNPKLRVFCVRNGNELDDANLALLAQMVDDAGYQCWIERIQSDGAGAIVIEEGHVKGTPVTEATEKPAARRATKVTSTPPPPKPEPVTAAGEDDL